MPSLWEVLKTSKGLPAPDGFTALFAHSLSDTYTLTEISGIPPLNLGEIVEIVDYTIYGNTYQSDGVSPDTPQEVVGVGEKTENLFDYITQAGDITEGAYTATRDNYLKSDGSLVTASGWWVSDYIEITGDFVTVSNIGGNVPAICVYDENKNFLRGKEYNTGGSTILGSCTIDTTGAKYVRFSFVRLTMGTIAMLNLGSTPLPYEPYGYKADVECRGKNLFDGEYEIGNILPSTGELQASSQRYRATNFIPIMPNTTYTFSKSSGTGFFWVVGYKDDFTGVEDGDSSYPASLLGTGERNEKTVATFTTTPTTRYIKWYTTYQSGVPTQLELGTEATSYEPYTPPLTTPIYLDSPLYKIGDYSDTLGSKEEVRAVKELVLTGEENMYIYTGTGSNGVAIPIADMRIGFYQAGFCSHAIVAKNHADGTIGLGVENKTLYWFGILDILGLSASVTPFREWLKEQYAAGTPVKVYYILAEPETKTVEPVEIPALDGTTVIDVDTEVKPSNLKITYKSRR